MSELAKQIEGLVSIVNAAAQKHGEAVNECVALGGLTRAHATEIIAALEAVEKLPKTADGVRVAPPMEAWRVNGFGQVASFEINQINPGHCLVFGGMMRKGKLIDFERWQSQCVFADRKAAEFAGESLKAAALNSPAPGSAAGVEGGGTR